MNFRVKDIEEITENDIEDLFSTAIDLLPEYATDATDKIRELESQARKLLLREDKEEQEEH